MDSSSEGVLLDPSQCSRMSVEEKREFVYQISKWSHGATELLQSWSRQEILQILCLEMGKERKYTGMTKLKMIEHLLKIVSEKRSGEPEEAENKSSASTSSRQRKAENPSRLPVPTSTTPMVDKPDEGQEKSVICKNTACKATLSKEDKFCKRCSCCICYKYDDNKDPSLWLVCNSEPPFQGDSCGMSCHLDCAFKHDKTIIARGGQRGGALDGIFYCAPCGKVNDILGCWRKQLVIAKDTRRVDILCYRLALTKKLTSGTEKYKEINDIVEEAVEKLEEELGPLSGVQVKIGRGIVNRLSSGPAVQKLCTSAVDLLDSFLSSLASNPPPKTISQDSVLAFQNQLKFEDIGSTSITVVLGSEDSSSGTSILYTIQHRGPNASGYPLQPTCTLSATNRRFAIPGLTPSSEYFFKVVVSDGTGELCSFEASSSTSGDLSADDLSNQMPVERSQSPATNCSSLSNPSSVEDETNNVAPLSNQNGEGPSPIEPGPPGSGAIVSAIPDSCAVNEQNKDQNIEETTSAGTGLGKECEASLPITPCKVENNNNNNKENGSIRARRSKPCSNDMDNGFGLGSTSKRRRVEGSGPINNSNDWQSSPDRDFEFYVKLIRWLECEGHFEKEFRQKFLTWYTLRANPQEIMVVRVFVDTLMDDPRALAEQLVHTFTDLVSSKGPASNLPSGFCMKLWH